MARKFVGSSSQYVEASSTPVTAAPLSMHVQFSAGALANNDAIFSIAAAGETAEKYEIGMRATGVARFQVAEAGANANADTVNTMAVDGVFQSITAIVASATDRTCVLDGDWANRGTSTPSRVPQNVDTVSIARTTSTSPGRYVTGDAGWAALWIAALVQEEAESLADGASPLLIRRHALVMFLEMIDGRLVDTVGGLSFTAFNSPTIVPHPGGLYRPAPSQIIVPAAAPAGAIAASIGGTSAIVAAIGAKGDLAGTLAGVGAVAAAIGGRGALAAALAGQGAVAASLRGRAAIAAALAGAATITANLVNAATIRAEIAGQATVTAGLSGTGALTSIVAGVGAVSADLGGTGALDATIAGAATVDADARAVGFLVSTVAGTATVTGDLVNASTLTASLAGAAVVIADLEGRGFLFAVAPGVATVAATAVPPFIPDPADVVVVPGWSVVAMSGWQVEQLGPWFAKAKDSENA